MHRIILIRHGEAAKTPTNADPGLTELGHQQARALATALEQKFTDPVSVSLISSPKTRALQTAIPVAQRWNKEVEEAEDVIEIPSPEGVPLAQRGQWIKDFLAAKWSELSPAQEIWRENIIRYLKQLEVENTSAAINTTLVFCHFMVINSVVAHIRGDDRVCQFHPDYTSRTEIILEKGQLRLDALGAEKDSGNLIQ